jgi:hypothetical protein
MHAMSRKRVATIHKVKGKPVHVWFPLVKISDQCARVLKKLPTLLDSGNGYFAIDSLIGHERFIGGDWSGVEDYSRRIGGKNTP